MCLLRPRDSASLQVSGAPTSLESVTISLSQNGGESGQLEAFGIDEFRGGGVQLTALRNGLAVGSAGFAFANVVGPKSGSDGPLSRTRGVTLLDYTTFWDSDVGGRGSLGLPPLPQRYEAVVYDIDKPLGSDLPDGEECEEKRRSGSVGVPGASQGALSVAGMDVRIIPGPGFVTRNVDDDYNPAGKSIGQVVSELLFTNGVRWWLEGDLVVVDGRALPSGNFEVPVNDRADVAENTFADELAGYERAPQLADYIARCAENIATEDNSGGTFETNADGVYDYTENSGTLGFGGAEGDYASVSGTKTKQSGRLVREFERGTGYVTVPAGVTGATRQLGPTYVRTLDKEFHPLVPHAEVKSVERTRSYADLSVIQSLEGTTGAPTDEQLELFRHLRARSPYVSSEKVVTQRWNAEGLLRVRTESSRSFSGVSTREVSGSTRLELLYNDEEQVEKWTPIGDGYYNYELSGYTMVDRPVFEVSDDETAEPVGIMSVRTPFSKHEETDSPPPSVSLPLPTCEQVNTCLVDAEREFARDYADWEARQANGVSRRVYSVRFNCLKLNLRRGQFYGGGYILDLTHTLARTQPGSTDVRIAVSLED